MDGLYQTQGAELCLSPEPPHFMLTFPKAEGKVPRGSGSLPESFSCRISWIFREVMVGLIIRFTRETFIKDRLRVLPCCLGLLGLGRAGSPCVLKEQQRETDAHYSRGIRNQLADPARRCNPFPSQDGACGESSS